MSISLAHSIFGIWTLLKVSLFTEQLKLKAQSTRTSPGEARLVPKGAGGEHVNLVFVTLAKMTVTSALCLTFSLKQLWQKLGQNVLLCLLSAFFMNIYFLSWNRSSDLSSSDEQTECFFVLYGLKCYDCMFGLPSLYYFAQRANNLYFENCTGEW